MRNKGLKRGLTFLLIMAVCCCFMPGLALAAEGTDAEQAAAPAAAAPAQTAPAQAAPAAPAAAKGAAVIQGVIAPAAKEGVKVTAAADKKDKSQLDIKTVNGTKEDLKVQVFLWKNDKSLTDGKKDNDKKEKAGEVTIAGLDKKTGEATIAGTKVKFTDGKDGRYLEYTVKAGKTADLKIKLEPVEGSKDKTLEVIPEVKFPETKAPEAKPEAAGTEAVTTGTQTNTNAAANDAQNKEESGEEKADADTKTDDGTEPEKTEVAVTKVWSDEEDKDKIRPANVTIKLFIKDGETLTDTGKTLVLDASKSWKDSFKDLDKQKDGKDIVYTVEEVAVTDYTAAVTGDQTAGFTVTNTHTPAVETDKVSVSGTITWNDSDDKYKKRPTKVTVRLYANKEEVQLTKSTADDSWKYEFKDLDKYDSNGKEISYTIKQDAVTNYTTTYKGYDITNKYKTSSSSSTTKKSSGTTSNTNRTSRNARTGDSTHLGLYLVLMVIAAAGVVTMVLRRRRG